MAEYTLRQLEYFVAVAESGSRPTRRAAAVAALSTEVLRRRGARISSSSVGL